MIYLDNGATSFIKPKEVSCAVKWAMENCANPGRGGHKPSMTASKILYRCRELAGEMFECPPERVVFTANCTHGLNIAINTVVKPGSKVAISGFEHNAVTRPLYARGVDTVVAGRKLFDQEDTLSCFEDAIRKGVSAVIVTHCSNVFGYILPVDEIAALCRLYRVPLIVDAAQSAGGLPVSLEKWGAEFIAMPGHKGLLGPQGTGLLLCGGDGIPLLQGGTGSVSRQQQMPEELPDRLEAGTVNVPGIAGLRAALSWLKSHDWHTIHHKEVAVRDYCAKGLEKLGFSVFQGENQSSTLSFLAHGDCQELAEELGKQGVAVRAGLHCAPLAHESAGTLEGGTVRLSFGIDAEKSQVNRFLEILQALP